MDRYTPSANLDLAEITSSLSHYWRVSVVDVTTSTQSDIKNHVGKKNGECLVANYQTHGRGRIDRTFDAKKSTALLFSYYVEPKRERKDWPFLTLLAGISTARVLNTYLNGADAIELKWPNDLMIREKKLGGIIAEQDGEGVIIGIGINVNANQEDLPLLQATSLFLEGSSQLDRNVILAGILNDFERTFTSWNQGEIFVDRYREISSTIGKHVKVILPSGENIEALAMDIDSTGALLLEGGERITAGDVVHLR